MQTINEIKPGAGIESKVEIIDVGTLKFYWKCFDCNKKEIAEEEIKICPNCKAEETKKKGRGLWVKKVSTAKVADIDGKDKKTAWLDLWGKDIEKYSLGDKVHLINCYAKKKPIGLILSKGKFGSIIKEV